MTSEDRFFVLIGKLMSVFGLLVVAILVGYALAQLYHVDQSYLNDSTPLLAPDSTPRKAKP